MTVRRPSPVRTNEMSAVAVEFGAVARQYWSL
jgi:hypothetical protein